MAAADTIWVDDDFCRSVRLQKKWKKFQRILWREKIRQMQRSRLKLKLSEGSSSHRSKASRRYRPEKENTDAANKTDEDYGTEESAYDGTTGEITAESDWTPVSEK